MTADGLVLYWDNENQLWLDNPDRDKSKVMLQAQAKDKHPVDIWGERKAGLFLG
jgi:hypothetical protein